MYSIIKKKNNPFKQWMLPSHSPKYIDSPNQWNIIDSIGFNKTSTTTLDTLNTTPDTLNTTNGKSNNLINVPRLHHGLDSVLSRYY